MEEFIEIKKVLSLLRSGASVQAIKTQVGLCVSEIQSVIKADRRVRSMTKKPRCATHIQLVAWYDAIPSFKHNSAQFCQDCTPYHQKKMIEQKKCNNPHIIFGWRYNAEDDGYELHGSEKQYTENAFLPMTPEEWNDPNVPMFKERR